MAARLLLAVTVRPVPWPAPVPRRLLARRSSPSLLARAAAPRRVGPGRRSRPAPTRASRRSSARTLARPARPLGRGAGRACRSSCGACARSRAPQTRDGARRARAAGPGQAATPAAGELRRRARAGLRERDLLVFDQRGTGRSGPLQLLGARAGRQPAAVVGGCAQQLGAARAASTGRATRSRTSRRCAREAGYEQLVLYGVSYGTKVALDYAARYPDRVERLVLDSVVPPEGPDPLQRSSFRAVPPHPARAVRRRRAAAAITPSAVRRRAARSSRRGRALRGTYVDAARAARAGRIDAAAHLRDPRSRRPQPGVARAAARRRARGGARRRGAARCASASAVARRAVGGSRRAAGTARRRGVNQALFLATICEEVRVPVGPRRAAPTRAASRPSAALRARAGDDVRAVRPRRPRRRSGMLGAVPRLAERDARARPARRRCPAVPTLVLGGAADVRTPAEDVGGDRRAARRARSRRVPHVGHSVLGGDRRAAPARRSPGSSRRGRRALPGGRAGDRAPAAARAAASASLRPAGAARPRRPDAHRGAAHARRRRSSRRSASSSAAAHRIGGLRGGTISRSERRRHAARRRRRAGRARQRPRSRTAGDARLTVSGRPRPAGADVHPRGPRDRAARRPPRPPRPRASASVALPTPKAFAFRPPRPRRRA